MLFSRPVPPITSTKEVKPSTTSTASQSSKLADVLPRSKLKDLLPPLLKLLPPSTATVTDDMSPQTAESNFYEYDHSNPHTHME